MNTHILIPIKDVERFEEAIRIGDWEYLSNMIFEGKQISLDEKDIEEKAEEYQKTTSRNLIPLVGYRQALLDLK